MAGAFALVAGLGDLSADGVRDWVEDAGVWAPVAFVAMSAALTVAFFPGPEAIVAIAVLVVMAVGGVIAFRRSGSGAGSSSPASPTAGPR